MNKNYQIGLEIIHDQFNFIITRQTGARWEIIETGTLPADGTEITWANLRKQISRRIRDMIIGLSFQDIMLKEMQIDSSLNDHEIYEFLRQRAPKLFWNQISCAIDFEILPSVTSEKKTIRVVAARQDIISNCQQLCAKHQFKLMAVDVDILAILRIANWIEGFDDQSPQALVWIREQEFYLTITHQQNLIYLKHASLEQDSFENIFISLLQFFYNLHPQYDLHRGFLLGHSEDVLIDKIKSKISFDLEKASLKGFNINPKYLLSLGLGIHPHGH